MPAGKYEQAARIYQNLTKALPDNPGLAFDFGLKAALPLDQDGSIHYQLARAYQATGQYALAQAALKVPGIECTIPARITS